MDKKTSNIVAALSLLILVAFGLFIKFKSQKKLSNEKREKLETKIIKEDSPLLEQRLQGHILLTPFLNKLLIRDNSLSIDTIQDTLFITQTKAKKRDFERILLNGASIESFVERTSNLTSQIPPYENDSIVAYEAVLDSVQDTMFVSLPYEVIFSVFREEDNEESSGGKKNRKIRLTPDKITITNPNYIEEIIANSDSKLILTAGPVWYHTSEILSLPQNQGLSQIDQLSALWNHARSNWNYIHDPVQESGRDTWRSSYETISTYNATSAKKFTGDCDDFAILCAAFARQIGYKSNIVAVYNGRGEGHAYAEFFVPREKLADSKRSIQKYFGVSSSIYGVSENGGLWIPMDWFGSESTKYLGQEPFQGRRKVYTNL